MALPRMSMLVLLLQVAFATASYEQEEERMTGSATASCEQEEESSLLQTDSQESGKSCPKIKVDDYRFSHNGWWGITPKQASVEGRQQIDGPTSVYECSEACNANATCLAFGYALDNGSHDCFIYSELPGWVCAHSWVRKGKEGKYDKKGSLCMAPEVKVKKFHQSRYQYFPSFDLIPAVATAQDCGDACAAKDDCEAFSWFSKVPISQNEIDKFSCAHYQGKTEDKEGVCYYAYMQGAGRPLA